MSRGRLIVLEGAEGVGKSTQAARLRDFLVDAGHETLLVREPGGTELGECIRTILLGREHDVSAPAEALLFMASRAELVARVLEPALSAGRTVIADRFFLSTYAYQVAGRGLPERLVRDSNLLATGGLVPDMTLLLELPAGAGLERAARRASPDRIETLDESFHARVADALRQAASAEWQGAHPECGPIVTVDATGSEAQVLEKLLEPLAAMWPETFAPGWGLHA